MPCDGQFRRFTSRGQTKIGDKQVIGFIDQQIGWLHIAVNNPLLMCVVKCARRLDSKSSNSLKPLRLLNLGRQFGWLLVFRDPGPKLVDQLRHTATCN